MTAQRLQAPLGISLGRRGARRISEYGPVLRAQLLQKLLASLVPRARRVTDEATEATSPLCLPKGSLEAAVLALPSGGEAA